jgi:hypothetical protein
MEWLATRLVCPSLKNEDSQLFMKKKKTIFIIFCLGSWCLDYLFYAYDIAGKNSTTVATTYKS